METSQLGAWRSLVVAMNLHQTNATYTLATATGDVVIDPTSSPFYVDSAAAAPLTSVAVVSNQTNPVTMLTTAEGAVANLIAQKTLAHAYATPFILRSGQLLQYVIAGGDWGVGAQVTVEIRYRPLGAGSGTLA